MSWDSKATVASRRRGNSIHNRSSSLSSNLTLQQKGGASSASAALIVEPKSAHVSDPFLQDFLQPSFDPAAYWNRTLANAPSSGSTSNASRGGSSSSGGGGAGGAASRLAAAATSATATADRAAQAQATLSQLGAHTSRLTTVLTQLTDDILRSGSRLAYEVELLRGETISLAELVQQQAAAFPEAKDDSTSPERTEEEADKEVQQDKEDKANTKEESEPASLAQLRMLAQVRSSLDAVIHMFGDAMEFVMPPSAMSVTASFLSVSGPDQDTPRHSRDSSDAAAAGSSSSSNSTSMEDKGQQVLKTKRDEIAKLLEAATIEEGNASMQAAVERVAALQTLCQVWVGTAEEKARTKFVDSLQRLVDDRQRELGREREKLEQQRQQQQQQQQQQRLQQEKRDKETTASSGGSSSASAGASTNSAAASAQGAQGQDAGGARGYAAAGYGFISQLQKIRSGL